MTHLSNVPRVSQPRNKHRISIGKVLGMGVFVLIGALILWIVINVVFAINKTSGLKVSWQGLPISSTTVSVTVEVHNPNSSPATPTCTITLNNASDTDTGIYTFIANNPIPAHRSQSYLENVTVTNHGAYNVITKNSSVKC